MKTPLLITERFDPTADLLLAELRRRGAPCVRWNLDCYPSDSTLTYRAGKEHFDTTLVSDGRRIDLADVGSVWMRSFQPAGLPADLTPEERQFAEAESRLALVALLAVSDPIWMNHPIRDRLANSKPAQLSTARRLGLEIPRTLVSNDPEEVRAFAQELGAPVVYKTLSQMLVPDEGRALYTGLLTAERLARLDLIRHTPGVFQELVAKEYEVRATAVGSRIFSARIESQSNEATRLDWRRAPLDLTYRPIQLPDTVEQRIRAYLDAFGLLYAAFDFIVTPDGRHVFLEANPAGQYMWIEAKTGLQITAAVADALIEPCRD